MDVRPLAPSPEADGFVASGVNVVVPTMAENELIGSVCLGDGAGRFPPERIAIAQELANQLAIVMNRLDPMPHFPVDFSGICEGRAARLSRSERDRRRPSCSSS